MNNNAGKGKMFATIFFHSLIPNSQLKTTFAPVNHKKTEKTWIFQLSTRYSADATA